MTTLATLAAHLLSTRKLVESNKRELARTAETLRLADAQRTAMVSFVEQLGMPQPERLHSVAHALAEPLHCAFVHVWLVGTERSKHEHQLLQTTSHIGRKISIRARGRGIVGYVATTGEALNVGDVHIHPQYDVEMDEAAAKLTHGETAMCVVPLRDPVGDVIGVLQAGGKHSGKLETYESMWLPDRFDIPVFTNEDADFMKVVADKMARELQLLLLSGKGPTEILDQQATNADLKSQAAMQQSALIEARRSLQQVTINAKALAGGAKGHGLTTRGERRDTSSSRKGTTTPLCSPSSSPRVSAMGTSVLSFDSRNESFPEAQQDLLSARLQATSTAPDGARDSADKGSGECVGITRFGISRDAQIAYEPSALPPVRKPNERKTGSVSSPSFANFAIKGATKRNSEPCLQRGGIAWRRQSMLTMGVAAPTTPEEVWDDLCRTLRDL